MDTRPKPAYVPVYLCLPRQGREGYREEMSEIRKSAMERESQGKRLGLLGLLIALVSAFTPEPGIAKIGLAIAVVGLLIWLAGMARAT